MLKYVLFGLCINICIATFGIVKKNSRQRMQYGEYLQKYGRSEGYNLSDVRKFM